MTVLTSDEPNIYRSERKVQVPSTDLLTWIFGTEEIHDPHRPVSRDGDHLQ